MSDEYIKKLSQIKKDIGVVQDSIFFELHKLNEINKSLESRIKELERKNSDLKIELKAEREVGEKLIRFADEINAPSKHPRATDTLFEIVARARARQKDRREV